MLSELQVFSSVVSVILLIGAFIVLNRYRCRINELVRTNDSFTLADLVTLARKFGHLGDHICTVDFVRFVFEECGETPPTDEELVPF